MPSPTTRFDYALWLADEVIHAAMIQAEAVAAANGTDHVTVTDDYMMQATDRFLEVDASSAPVEITLPDLSAREFSIKKKDASPNAVTISGAVNIEGEASAVISSKGHSITLAGGTSEWLIV